MEEKEEKYERKLGFFYENIQIQFGQNGRRSGMVSPKIDKTGTEPKVNSHQNAHMNVRAETQ